MPDSGDQKVTTLAACNFDQHTTLQRLISGLQENRNPMPSIYDLKPGFQRLLRPITRGLASKGVTANQVTLSAMLLSVAVGACLAILPQNHLVQILVPAALFVRMALNAIDGMLAREHNMKSRLGAVLNEIGDVISDAALYLPVALMEGIHPVLVVTFVILAIVSEMTGVVSIQIGGSRRYDGPMGKSDRAVVMGLLCLLAAGGVTLKPWCNWLLGSVSGLLLVTIWNRASRALKEAASHDEH